jgi:hypothetical protein
MSKPTLIAYTVKERGEGKKAIWTRIGAAWPHETGKGLTVSAGAKIPHWKRPRGSVAPE